MRTSRGSDTIRLRYVYMIEADNRGKRSKFYGAEKVLYTGQTNDLKRRLTEHVRGVNSHFLNRYFRDSRKTLVYVEYVFGTEWESIAVEMGIKRSNTRMKRALIVSDRNVLVQYVPLKAIILKKYLNLEEQECIYL